VDPSGYRCTTSRVFFAPPAESAAAAALERLLAAMEGGRVRDVVELRWAVSFHRSGLRDQYVFPAHPGTPDARPFVGGAAFAGNGELRRYRLEWAGNWIRYATDELRELGNSLPPETIFAPPKLVLCQNARTLRVALDEEGLILKDTLLCGRLRDQEHPLCRRPRALVGLLSSQAIHFLYSHLFEGGHVGAGYLHFLSGPVGELPVGRWDPERVEAVAELAARRETADPGEWDALEAAMEQHVAAALGLEAHHRAAIAGWAAADTNWQGRERVRVRERIGRERSTGDELSE